MSKIGLGIITCARVNMYHVCFDSLNDGWYDEFVAVNDGKEE